jgi:hypothetical protein
MRQSSISSHSLRMHATAVACGFLLIVAGAQAGLGQQPATKSGTPATSGVAGKLRGDHSPQGSECCCGAGREAKRRSSRPGQAAGRRHPDSWPLGAGGQGRRRKGERPPRVRQLAGHNLQQFFFNGCSPRYDLRGGLSGSVDVGGNIVPSDPAIGFVQGTLTGDPSLWCASSLNGGPTSTRRSLVTPIRRPTACGTTDC